MGPRTPRSTSAARRGRASTGPARDFNRTGLRARRLSAGALECSDVRMEASGHLQAAAPDSKGQPNGLSPPELHAGQSVMRVNGPRRRRIRKRGPLSKLRPAHGRASRAEGAIGDPLRQCRGTSADRHLGHPRRQAFAPSHEGLTSGIPPRRSPTRIRILGEASAVGRRFRASRRGSGP